MKKKMLIMVGILTAVIVVLVAGYFGYKAFFVKKDTGQNQATDETADWKTYEDKRSGIKINYPPSLFPVDCANIFDPSEVMYIYFSPDKNNNCNFPPTYLPSSITFSIEKDFKEEDHLPSLENRIVKKISIKGTNAVEISGHREELGGEGEKLSSEPIREEISTIISWRGNESLVITYSRIASIKNNDNGYVVGKDLSKDYQYILESLELN